MCTSISNIPIDVTLQVAKKARTWFWCLYTSHWWGFLMTNATTVCEERRKDPCLWLGTVPTVFWWAAQGALWACTLRIMGLDPAKSSAWKFFKKFHFKAVWHSHTLTVEHCATYRKRVQVTHLEGCEGVYCSWSNLYATCYRAFLSSLVLPWSNKNPK